MHPQMSKPIIVRVFRNENLGSSITLPGDAEAAQNQIELGRQRPGEPAEFFHDKENQRLVIAPINDKLVSRKHVLLSYVPFQDTAAIEIRNLSTKRSINVEHFGKLAPEETTTRQLPATINFEDFSVVADYPQSESVVDDGSLRTMSLGHQTLAPSPSKLAAIKTSGLVRQGLESTAHAQDAQARRMLAAHAAADDDFLDELKVGRRHSREDILMQAKQNQVERLKGHASWRRHRRGERSDKTSIAPVRLFSMSS